MRVVRKGEDVLNFPGVCVFSQTSDGDLLDTGFWLNAKALDTSDPYGYIEVGLVKTMAREVGMVDPSEIEIVDPDYVSDLEAKAAAWDALSAAREKVAA